MSPDFHVLLVATDRALLRQGALMLREFGVQVSTCADPSQARQALEAGSVDFVIVDEQVLHGHLDRVNQWKQYTPGRPHLHVLALRGEHSVLDIEDACQAGIDDFLRKPLSAGELLARLRAAARYTEFERRFSEQSWQDPVTGAWARQALFDRLHAELKPSTRGRKLALLLLEIDFFDRWPRLFGEEASHRLLKAIAVALQQNSVPGQLLARTDRHQFGILLPDHSPDKASKVAERLRTVIQGLEVPGNEQLTVSIGVAAVQSEQDSASEFLARAVQALEDAQRSGRDCIAMHGQHEDERRKWAQQVSSGNPFASCIARDVMTPFSIELSSTDTIAYAGAVLAQTRLDLLPVLDFHGRFLGIASAENVREALTETTRSAQPVEQVVDRQIPKLAETTSFAQVIEHFVQDDLPLLIVTSKEGAVRGFIEREQFLSLVKPLAADTFLPAAFSDGTDYLLVPDLVETA